MRSTHSIASASGPIERGVRVIVLDLDPQANATSAFGLVPGERDSIYQSLINGASVAELVVPTKYPNLWLIPSDLELAGCEIELARAEGEVGLRTFFFFFPDARLDGEGSRRDTRVLRGWATLPIRLGDAHSAVPS